MIDSYFFWKDFDSW